MKGIFLIPLLHVLQLKAPVANGFSTTAYGYRECVPCSDKRRRNRSQLFHCPSPCNRLQIVPKKSFHLDSTFSTSTSLRAISMPIVAASDTWGNIAALTGTATIAQVLGKTTRVGRLLGPPVAAMAISFVLASIGILNPGGTGAAKSLQLLSLQLATPLILLGADLRDCLNRCGPLLLSFTIAALSTIIACTVGWYASGNMLTAALGQDGLIIAAALMAKNVGGGINYMAVCRSLSASPQAIAAGYCIDNIFALIYFPATNAIGVGRPDVATKITTSKEGPRLESSDDKNENDGFDPAHSSSISSTITVQSASNMLFLASLLLWLGEKIGGTAGGLPCCTLLAVVFAALAPNKWMAKQQHSANVMGTCCLYLFFATAGAPGLAVAESVRSSLVPLGLFLFCMYGIHGSILWACHHLVLGRRKESSSPSFLSSSFEPQRLLVASSAAIGGPATSVALAQANGWKSLLVPSLLVGNIGYAIATFCGIAYHAFLKR